MVNFKEFQSRISLVWIERPYKGNFPVFLPYFFPKRSAPMEFKNKIRNINICVIEYLKLIISWQMNYLTDKNTTSKVSFNQHKYLRDNFGQFQSNTST